MWGSGSRLPAARPRETFDALPVSVNLSPSRGAAVAGLLGAGFLLVGAWIFRQNLAGPGAASDLVALGIPLLLAALGIFAALRSLPGLFARRVARFENGHVHVTGRSLSGGEDWTAPLSTFDGVGWRIVRRQRSGSDHNDGRKDSSIVYQVIELIHPDPARTLPLHVRQSRRDAREVWEGIARTLGLPAIDLREGRRHVRAAEDLDKSVRELAVEGKVAADWQGDAEPPPGISWQSTGTEGSEALTVRLHARRFPLWLYAGIAGMGALFVVGGLLDAGWPMALVGLAIAAGAAWYWRFEPSRPRELHVTRREVSFVDPLVNRRETLRHDAIEEIRVVPSNAASPGPGKLVISSDAGEIRTGEGLSRDALEWLRAYLTTAIVKA